MTEDQQPPALPATTDELDPREERFCQLMATGEHSATGAYRIIRPELSENSFRTLGPRLYAEVRIQRRIRQILDKAAEDVGFTLAEWQKFQRDIIRTPIADIDEHHPLCQEITYKVEGGAVGKLKRGPADEGNEVVVPPSLVIKKKMPSKQDAARELAKHHGWYAQPDENMMDQGDPLLAFLMRIRKPGIPKVIDAEVTNVPPNGSSPHLSNGPLSPNGAGG